MVLANKLMLTAAKTILATYYNLFAPVEHEQLIADGRWIISALR